MPQENPENIVVRRPAALRDLAEAASHLKAEAGPELSHRFLVETEGLFIALSFMQKMGKPWPSANPSLRNMRCSQLRNFPYSIFYLPIFEGVEIVRVLHHKRDIAPLLEFFEDQP